MSNKELNVFNLRKMRNELMENFKKNPSDYLAKKLFAFAYALETIQIKNNQSENNKRKMKQIRQMTKDLNRWPGSDVISFLKKVEIKKQNLKNAKEKLNKLRKRQNATKNEILKAEENVNMLENKYRSHEKHEMMYANISHKNLPRAMVKPKRLNSLFNSNLKKTIDNTMKGRTSKSVRKLKRNVNKGMSEPDVKKKLADLNKRVKYKKGGDKKK
jgi:hypothetical protein